MYIRLTFDGLGFTSVNKHTLLKSKSQTLNTFLYNKVTNVETNTQYHAQIGSKVNFQNLLNPVETTLRRFNETD